MFPCSCLSLHIRLESPRSTHTLHDYLYVYISKCSYLVPPYSFSFSSSSSSFFLFVMFTEIKRYVTFAFYRICIYIYIIISSPISIAFRSAWNKNHFLSFFFFFSPLRILFPENINSSSRVRFTRKLFRFRSKNIR